MSVFPLLSLGGDVLSHIVRNHLDVASGRNLMLTCKTAYNAIPKKFRRKSLWCLSVLRRNARGGMRFSDADYQDYKTCASCGIYSKRHWERHRNRCPGVVKQCYICWKYLAGEQYEDHRDDSPKYIFGKIYALNKQVNL